eukprot:scaffold12619_cov107-Cylindrotheca_fusiformis.AAC.4
METLAIGPGPHNGEDITVVISATSVESNPTEPGEVAVPEVNVVKTFVVPVGPVIQGNPEISIPNLEITGNEDTKIETGITVSLNGIVDTDGSEEYYIEIARDSFPTRTKFFVDGENYWTEVDGWIRMPNPTSSLQVRPPPNFSGTMALSVRGSISDITMDQTVTKATDAQTVTVNVLPKADSIGTPPNSEGVEDLGPVAFGSVLAASNGIRAKDNGGGVGNNPESETFSKVEFVIPGDSPQKTYTITGSYALTSGSIPGVGSATVVLTEDGDSRTYIITSSIVNDADDLAALSYEKRVEASADIMATLATFEVEMGPEHTDLNGDISVKVTTLDVNLGEFHERDSSFNHQVIIKAVADSPSIFIHDAADAKVTTEDGLDIPLKVTVTRSADDDGSEDLYMRVTVPTDAGGAIGSIVGVTPSGVTLQNQGSGIFVIRATCSTASECESALNGFVDGGNFAFKPRENWSGNSTLTVEVIAVEKDKDEIADDQYGGSDGDSEHAIDVGYIDITVKPVADVPTLKIKGDGIGFEDTRFGIAIGATLGDTDGSEQFITTIDGDSVPAGTTLFGNGVELVPKANGDFVLQPAELDSLQILPPLHWSSALQGNIVLKTTTIVTDESAGFVSEISFDFEIPVVIVGVADPPNTKSFVVVATEDEDYKIGQAVGSLDGVLVDDDGSEKLSLVIGGLPPGTQVQTKGTPPYYIGHGEWQIELEDVPSMTISPLPNYSGDDPFPDFTFRAISQEMDGDETTSNLWDVSFHVYPVADGFADWDNKITVSESQNEDEGLGVSLADLGNYTFMDKDGSETVVEFTFDLSNLIADAKIGKRLESLAGQSAGLDELVDGFLDGTYDYNSGTGLVTVAESNIAGMRLSAELFLDSNEDFQIPVTALIKDVATIDGAEVFVTITSTATYEVDLVGTADVPTVHAESVSGARKIPIQLGGESTDTDVELGRDLSESVYYIVSKVDVGNLPGYSFSDINDAVVGFGGGEGTWMMTKKAVDSAIASGGLFFRVPKAPLGWNYQNTTREPAIFQLMAVAVENDGDAATSTTNFSVSYWEYEGPGLFEIPEPLPPIVDIGINEGLEDITLPLNLTATRDPNDASDSIVSIVFREILEGANITGPHYNNYVTGTKVALAEDVNAGSVGLAAPKDFAGVIDVIIDAIAANIVSVSVTAQSFQPFY